MSILFAIYVVIGLDQIINKEVDIVSYRGKKVIRIVGRIKSGVGMMVLEYADHTVQIVTI